MKDKKVYVNYVRQFIDEYFPYCYGAMITGSFVSEYFNETSDIDVIILSNLWRSTFVESYPYKGIKIQVIVFPVFDLDSVIRQDIAVNGGIYLGQLYKGVIIKDRDNILKNLKNKATQIYLTGPAPLDRYFYDQYRARLTTRIEDIDGNDDFDENLFTVLDLYPRILEFYSMINRHWAYSGKNAKRILKEKDPEFAKRFTGSITKFVETKDKSSLVEFLHEFIDKVGGGLHFSSTRNIRESEIKDCLVVFVSDNGIREQRDSLRYIADKFKTFVTDHVKGISAFSYIYPSKRVFASGLYLICYLPAKHINEELLPLVEMFHLNLRNSALQNFRGSFYYPYNINPLDIFGNYDEQKRVIKLIYLISRQVVESTVPFTIDVLSRLRAMNFFKDANKWKAFWQFAYDATDKVGNSVYVPIKLAEYYSANKLDATKKRFAEMKKTEPTMDAIRAAEIVDSIKDIETGYTDDPTYTFGLSGNVLASNEYLKNNKDFCIFLVNLVQVIMNSLSLSENDKLLVTYSIINK